MVMHKTAQSNKEVVGKYDINKSCNDESTFPDPLEVLGEKSFDQPYEVPEHDIGTPIQEFFRGKNVLITGATGFMGKLLIEKLIRSVPHLKKLFLVIRIKKGKDVDTRLKELFEDAVFKRIKYEKRNFMDKIQVVAGDCSLPNFGFSTETYAELSDTIDVIFHGAACVKLDEKIKTVIVNNAFGTLQMINFAKCCKNLKCFVYISTAFSNWKQNLITDDFFPIHIDYSVLYNLIKNKSDDELERITPNIIGEWPNTYSFSKATAEAIVRQEGRGFPIVVFRPAIVISTSMEPIRGWIDNMYGPIALVIGTALGVIRVIFCSEEVCLDMVPGDMAVNALIASSYKGSLEKPVTKEEDILIFNYSSANDNQVTVKEFINLNIKHGHYWPSISAIWYTFVLTTTNPILYAYLNFFLHRIPGYIIDFFLLIAGKKPRLTKVYAKLDKFTDIGLKKYFGKNTVIISENIKDLWEWLSPEDKTKYPFNIRDLNWDNYYQSSTLGLRQYLFKEDIGSIQSAKRKQKIFKLVHYLTVFILGTLAFTILWKLVYFLVY